MHEDDGMTAVEFGPHRVETPVAEVVAVRVGFDGRPIAAEIAQGVRDLAQGTGDVRQRQAGELAEPAGVVAD